MTATAEFVGGGITPHHTVNPVRLFANNGDPFSYVVMAAESLFVISILYYIINIVSTLKKEGCRKFCENTWNIADCITVILSVLAVILYVVKFMIVRETTKSINETRGNVYIRLTIPALLNQYYEYLVAMTVFTSTIKFSKLLSFQKAFMQVSATIKLCFLGLSTFVVEFAIVFGAFCSFFFFVLKNDLEKFRDFLRTVENTLAMSIGKFNFAELRDADQLAAWIFFIFSSM